MNKKSYNKTNCQANNKKDWQNTQNKEYLNLLRIRLTDLPLTWVTQFIDIIKSNLINSRHKCFETLRINDFGCNVGHFYRGCQGSLQNFIYTGYDISETYLSIARSALKISKSDEFILLDISSPISKPLIKPADISVISATLEHIENYSQALENIFSSTSQLVILRTFIGKESLKDYCLTYGAKEKYLIQQFALDDLIRNPNLRGWNIEFAIDKATNGDIKFVCNGKKYLAPNQY